MSAVGKPADRVDGRAKVTGAAAGQRRTLELQFSWNSGYVEADAESGRHVRAYKNRPRYGLILPPDTSVEFRIKFLPEESKVGATELINATRGGSEGSGVAVFDPRTGFRDR